MNPIQVIATLRKFGNYIVGLFPVLAILAERFSAALAKVKQHRCIRRLRARFRKSKRARALAKFLERFFWRSYAKDRLIFDDSLGPTLPLLRRTLQLCVILSLSIPLTQFRWYPLQIETFSGFKTTVPTWATIVWLVSLPVAWSAILVGAAKCNRVAFAVAAAAAVYFLSTPVLFTERSYINMFLGLAVLSAFRYSEQSLSVNKRSDLLRSVAATLFVGAVCGVQMTLLSPLKPYLASLIPLPGPVVGIGGGALIGALVAMVALIETRAPFLGQAPDTQPVVPELRRTALTITALLISYLVAAACRSSAENVAGAVVSSLSMINNYLWPMWYFIGVGIFHKLMGSSRVVATVVEDVIPKRILTPLLVLLLLLALVATSSEALNYAIADWSGAPVVFEQFGTWLFSVTQGPIWSNPTNATSAHWMTWVLVFDLLIIIYLGIRRRLTRDTTARLFYLTCLASLLISEYLFQLSSFAKTPTNSVVFLFLFSASLLWLVHTVGWSTALRSSPLWPSQGRLLLLAGIICVAMLQIQARAAIKDFKVMNELFLTMFHGVIDIGLPYYLYFWASRTVKTFPVRIPSMLGMFCLGALASFIFNAGEKLAICQWSLSGLQTMTQTVSQQLSTAGTPNLDFATPPEWFLIRATLYACMLGAIYQALRTKSANRTERARMCVFLWLAFASGIASFSRTLVDLPVPLAVTALIAPVTQELVFNCNVFQSYLAWWIPTLLLLLAQLRDKPLNLPGLSLLTLAAIGLNFAITILFTTDEYYLRAAGLAYLAVSILLGLFAILVARVLILSEHKTDAGADEAAAEKTHSVAEATTDTDEVPKDYLDMDADCAPPPPSPAQAARARILSAQSFIGLIVLIEAILIALAVYRFCCFRTKYTEVPALHARVILAGSWQLQAPTTDTADTTSRFVRKPDGHADAVLYIGTTTATGLEDLLITVINTGRHQGKPINQVAIIKTERWNRLRHGAISCFFSYEEPAGNSAITMSGSVVIVPSKGESPEFYLLVTSPSTVEQERWEIPLAIQSR